MGTMQLKGFTVAHKLLVTARHLFVLGEFESKDCIAPSKEHGWLNIKKLWEQVLPSAHAGPGFGAQMRPRRRQDPGTATCMKEISTVLQAFKLRPGRRPKKVKSWRFKGGYVDARLTASRIVMIFRQPLNLARSMRDVLDDPFIALGEVPAQPIEFDTRSESVLLSCNSIYRTKISDLDFQLTKIVAIDVNKLNREAEQVGFVGGGEHVYMSTKNLYLSKAGKKWVPWEESDSADTQRQTRNRRMRDGLVITKVGFDADSGAMQVLARTNGEAMGRPKDSWAFKELVHEGEELLGVFTTTGTMWSTNEADKTNNYLWVMRQRDSTLTVAAKLENIAPGEDIRSVRYVGKWAYAVTFKKTDPLFAIDLTRPLEPRLVGQLKIPGFSTYMHPVGEGQLIGIGFDTFEDPDSKGKDAVKFQGLKVSLFDVSDPKAMREVASKTYGGRGSYSDATGDHHAFFFDPKLRRLSFPMTLLEGESKTEKWETDKKIDFAGAPLLQIKKEGFKELARWRHNTWIPKECYDEMMQGRWWEAQSASLDINRIFRVGSQYLTASRNGLKTYRVNSPRKATHSLMFPRNAEFCESPDASAATPPDIPPVTSLTAQGIRRVVGGHRTEIGNCLQLDGRSTSPPRVTAVILIETNGTVGRVDLRPLLPGQRTHRCLVQALGSMRFPKHPNVGFQATIPLVIAPGQPR